MMMIDYVGKDLRHLDQFNNLLLNIFKYFCLLLMVFVMLALLFYYFLFFYFGLGKGLAVIFRPNNINYQVLSILFIDF